MKPKQAYEQKLQAKLDEWQAGIKMLEARAAQADAELKLEIDNEIGRLHERQQKARKRLEELRDSSEDAWEHLKAGVEQAFHDMGEGFKAASKKYH